MRNLKKIKPESAKQRRTMVSGNGYIKKHLEFIAKEITENDIDFMEIKRAESKQITETVKDKTLVVMIPGNIPVNLFVNNIRNLLKRKRLIYIECTTGTDRIELKNFGYKRCGKCKTYNFKRSRRKDDDGTGTAGRNGKRYKIIK